MSHWASQYIGLSWRSCADGPDAYDCWNFFRLVQREHYGVSVPTVGFVESWREAATLLETHEERQRWQQVERPLDGCAVLMARTRLPVHIGTWIRANGTEGVLHCMQGAGVVFQRPEMLRAAGWGRLTYYRQGNAPAS